MTVATTDNEAMRPSETELVPFFTFSLDMLCLAGADGYFKRLNPMFEATLGFSIAELTSHPWLEFVHPDDVDSTVAAAGQLAIGKSVIVFENRYRCRDGTYKWLAWQAASSTDRNVFYCVARDMTATKKAEQKLQLQNQLLDAAIFAEREAHALLKRTQSHLVQSEKLAGLGQMVAGVAHEINNPLAFVSNNVAVAQREFTYLLELAKLHAKLEVAPPEARAELQDQLREARADVDLDRMATKIPEMFARTREGLRRIQQIVKDLREFARLDSTLVELVDLNAGIVSTVNIIRGHAMKKRIEIQLELAEGVKVTCHQLKINQVVMNLLSNAIDASPVGENVMVRTRMQQGGGASIEIIDRGDGIPPAIRGKIFDPFFTTKPVGHGTGLGLSISYGIVRDHGGSIEAADGDGGGTRFIVRLPERPAPAILALSTTGPGR